MSRVPSFSYESKVIKSRYTLEGMEDDCTGLEYFDSLILFFV